MKKYKIESETDMKLLGITLCDHRENIKGISKRQMDEKHGINAHTLNAIEKGKRVGIHQLLQYCKVLNFEITINVEEVK